MTIIIIMITNTAGSAACRPPRGRRQIGGQNAKADNTLIYIYIYDTNHMIVSFDMIIGVCIL